MPPPSAKPSSGGSSVGRFFGLLFAGILGGVLALLGAELMRPQLNNLSAQLGVSGGSPEAAAIAEKIEDRIAALEGQVSATADQPIDQITRDLETTQTKIAEIETLKTSLAEIRGLQDKLSESTTQLAQQIKERGSGASGASPEQRERIEKLEQQLQTMVSAAGENPGAGTLPELAAVSGRIADLETSLDSKLVGLRDSLTQAVEQRLTEVAEVSQQAQSAAQRIDREMSRTSTDSARLGQRMEALKADGDRVGQTLRVVQEETGKLRATLDTLKGDVDAEFGKVARPNDIATALEPVMQKLTALEQNVAGVVSAEKDRKANAQRIVLSLELANLKRAIDGGDSYKKSLSAVQDAAEGVLDVSTLTQFEDSGVPTLGELKSSFQPVIGKILDAAEKPQSDSVFDQFLSGAKSVVRVRNTSPDPNDKSAEAVVSRMESDLSAGQLGRVLEHAQSLDEDARKAASGWLENVKARHAVDVALANIEDQLKSSLSGGQAG